MKNFVIVFTIISLLVVGMGMFFLSPEVVYAQEGLVPCGGAGQPECNACHIVQLAEKVINFIVTISFVVAALLFAYAGFLFFTGGADPGKITNARSIFTNTIVGIVIILTAWLLVNVILTTLTGQGVNPFTKVFCEVNVSNFKNIQPSDSPTGGGIQVGGEIRDTGPDNIPGRLLWYYKTEIGPRGAEIGPFETVVDCNISLREVGFDEVFCFSKLF